MYDKVIVAVDLSDEADGVIEKALELVGSQPNKLVLIHVVEPIPAAWGAEAYMMSPIELQDKIVENASMALGEAALKHGISTDNQHTVLGSPAHEIRDMAESQKAGAIVIGSHGHSGWRLMLGSTANKLLHGATCDVLTVLVGKNS